MAGPDVFYRGRGELEQFTFRWTVADNIGAILASGCELVHIEEFGDWTCFGKVESSPMSGEELEDAAATVYERI